MEDRVQVMQAIYLQFKGLEEFMASAFSVLVLLVIVLVILAYSIRIIREYERAVVFRLGRIIGAKGPGLIFVIPIIDRITIVDLRLHTVDVPRQKVITRDNVEVSVDAVVYYRVADPIKAIMTVRNYHYAVTMLAQTTLRDVLGKHELDDLLARREELNKELQRILDELTDPWGIKVTAVTVKEVVLPEGLIRAMARQAEAERWRRAKIIEADAERQAAKILAEAAKIYASHPQALRLRELHTMSEVAKEKNMVLLFPVGIGVDTASLVAALAASQASTQKPSGTRQS